MKMQIIDCDYTLLQGKPLLRMIGKTEEGKTVCAFYDKKRPYFYIHTDIRNIDRISEILREYSIDIDVVDKIIPVGFQKAKKIVKIYGKDPSKVPEMKDKIKEFGKVYEADILFKYRFMIDNNLKGMQWVDVEGSPVKTGTVKCKAIHAEDFKPLDDPKNAPLKYLTFDIECITHSDRLPQAEVDPMIMVSLIFSEPYQGSKSKVIVAKPMKVDDDVIACNDEKEMLEKFREIILDYDPDVIGAFNGNNFDWPYILKRMEVLGVKRDLGRVVGKNVFSRTFGQFTSTSVMGRVLVDPYELIKNDPWVRLKRYDLRTIAKEMLDIEKLDVGGPKEFVELWENGGREGVKKLSDYCRRDSELVMELIIKRNLLDQFLELAKVSGLLFQDAFGGQTQRLDTKLLHEFRDRNMIMPCKPSDKEMLGRKKEREEAGLKGALVLEPDSGLHKDGCVLVLDFKSLYPSIVKVYNICPTTLLLDEQDVKYHKSPFGSRFVEPSVREGVLPKVVRELINTRSEVKKKMFQTDDPETKRMLNAKQLALKTMANSLYGYTGFVRSRLYVMDIANSITSYGRFNIEKTRDNVEKEFGVKVVYGDTDSIFVKTDVTDLDAAQKLGDDMANYATERMDGLELEFEKIFKTFLLMSKKRYAGWSFEKRRDGTWKDKIDMKGIETVRRDWCSLTTETMIKVLNIVLKEQDVVKASKYVRSVFTDLAKGNVSIERLTIVKGITKKPEEYDGVQPHVEVVKKVMERDPSRGLGVGSRIGFVIIKGNDLLSKRAEDPDYVVEKNLPIDSTYYLENQLMPPIERIFDTCGVSKQELVEGSRQKSLFDVLKTGKQDSPERTTLDNFEKVACSKCHWSFRRPPLLGVCPKCSGALYFSYQGSLGKFVS